MRQIMIDFDIHKLIETERRNFEETENTALRRLLDLPPSQPQKVSVPQSSPGGSGLPWRSEGIELPHGTEVFMTYGRGAQKISGKIENGDWVVNGRRFNSPSGAASNIATKPDGSHPTLGGFKYWKVRLPGSMTWVAIDSLRDKKESIASSNRSAEELGL